MGFILDFLFGKSAKIFNKKGKVQHDLGEQKWQEWNNRLQEDPQYNWRQHKGRQAPTEEKSSTQSK